MTYIIYELKNEVGSYFGNTTDLKRRMAQHRHPNNNECASKYLFDFGEVEIIEHITYTNKEEAALTEAMLINSVPCINKREEKVIGLVCNSYLEYLKLYRTYCYDVVNKKNKCDLCGKKMLARNIHRHKKLNCKGVSKLNEVVAS